MELLHSRAATPIGGLKRSKSSVEQRRKNNAVATSDYWSMAKPPRSQVSGGFYFTLNFISHACLRPSDAMQVEQRPPADRLTGEGSIRREKVLFSYLGGTNLREPYLKPLSNTTSAVSCSCRTPVPLEILLFYLTKYHLLFALSSSLVPVLVY